MYIVPSPQHILISCIYCWMILKIHENVVFFQHKRDIIWVSSISAAVGEEEKNQSPLQLTSSFPQILFRPQLQRTHKKQLAFCVKKTPGKKERLEYIAILNGCLMFHVSMYTFIKTSPFHRTENCFCCRALKTYEEYLYSDHTCSPRARMTEKHTEKKNVNKNMNRVQFKVSNSAHPFELRSCNEIDINILFISNTKCIHPRGHLAWLLHFAKASRIDIKMLHINSTKTSLWPPRLSQQFIRLLSAENSQWTLHERRYMVSVCLFSQLGQSFYSACVHWWWTDVWMRYD